VVGVSESTLKRWADGGRLRFTKTAGGHRRISVPEAVRFARRSRLPIVDPELLGLPGVSAQTTRITAPGQGVTGADPPRSSADTAAVLAELLRCDQPVIFDTVVGPALNGFGELWRHDAAGIYLEHRAFDICVQAVNALRGLIPAPADDAPVAVGGSPAGDVFLMSSLMTAAVLADAGYRAVNLGAQLPLDTLRAAAQHYGAAVVWLACSRTTRPPPHRCMSWPRPWLAAASAHRCCWAAAPARRIFGAITW